MTSDQRFEAIESVLDKVAAAQRRSQERHEALAETVEILTRDVQQDAENIRALARNSQILHDSIKSLEVLALTHEHRIEHLEDQQ
jgi:hypothetical protein